MDAKQRRKERRRVDALMSAELDHMIAWIESPVDPKDIASRIYKWAPTKSLIKTFTKFELCEFLRIHGHVGIIPNYRPLRSKEEALCDAEGSLTHAASRLKAVCKKVYGASCLAYGKIPRLAEA